MAQDVAVAVLEEEEDLGAALNRLEIPYKDLQNSFGDSYDAIKDIIEDSNLLNPSHNVSIGDSHDDSRSLVAIRPRNKRGRRKRRCFKSGASLFGSGIELTDKSCLHCGTRNTPLWREGPRGPGTLCNACGMRYRTGRLLPEYRPASSPGFKPNVHSNFHRKVMEIRREKISPPNSFGF